MSLKEIKKKYQAGQFKGALTECEKLLKHHNISLDLYNLRGLCLRKLSKQNSAIENFKLAIEKFPANAVLQNNLGNCYLDSGNVECAHASYSNAVELDPKYQDAIFNLATTDYRLGDFDKAAANFQKLLDINPGHEQCIIGLGRLYASNGEANKALILLESAIKNGVRTTEIYSLLGIQYLQSGRISKAFEHFRTSLNLNVNQSSTWNNMGVLYQRLKEYENSVTCFEQALQINKNEPNAFYNLGLSHMHLENFKSAEAAFKSAISSNPEGKEAFFELARMYEYMGNLEKSTYYYRKVIELDRNDSKAYLYLANSNNITKEKEIFKNLEKLSRTPELPILKRIDVHFALGKAFSDINDYAKSFGHYAKANKAKKEYFNYSIDTDRCEFEKLASNAIKLDTIKLKTYNVEAGCVPIFIVGMPRSGTSMIEQILSSHDSISGGGELELAYKYGYKLSTGAEEISTQSLTCFRNSYLSEIQKISNGRKFVTDKMPHNFRFLPLIIRAIPEAKIVLLHREPQAICWSIFKNHFVEQVHNYGCDLLDLVSYYKLFKKLMDQYSKYLETSCLVLDYEKFVANQRKETEVLLSYLGLEWNENCMHPERNKRAVKTASKMQVRNKIYSGSSKEWQKYEQFLPEQFINLA